MSRVIKKLIHIECPHCGEQFPKTVKIIDGKVGESSFQDNCPYCGEMVTVKLDRVIAPNVTVLKGEVL